MTVTQAVKELFENERAEGNEIHSLTVYRRGEKIVSIAPAPYSPFQKNHVYSLSKSFCSTAVGIACDLGYLSLDEKIVDIFPDKCPEYISENLAQMTLYNVLSMNTGHEGCRMYEMVNSDDPVKAFLAQEVQYKPGTHFAYNTGATYLASACVTERTGLSVLAFLEKHLFKHMDIDCSQWYGYKGITEGGVGFHVCTEDAAKLGLLYINGGIYKGKRLLSKNYIKDATSFISDNSGNGTADWSAGYGLQFWRNSREGYRGDGAFGQLLLVFPKRDIVIAMIAECSAMQSEIDALYTFIDDVEKATGKADYEELTAYLNSYYPAYTIDDTESEMFGKTYKLDNNKCAFSTVRFEKREDGIDIYIASDSHINKIPLRSGKWESGTLRGSFVKPVLERLTVNYNEPLEYSCSGKLDENGNILAVLRGTNCPHLITYLFEIDGENIKITRRANKNSDYALAFTGSECE